MTRLSPQLKKRLQANLETLTAREAGRLLLLYYHEAEKKFPSLEVGRSDRSRGLEYPPIDELWAAMESRVKKSRGKPEEKEAVYAFNGLVFLNEIVKVMNLDDFVTLATANAFDSFRVMTGLGVLFQRDSTTELIQFIKGRIEDDFPKPVSAEEYRRLTDWLKTDALWTLEEAAINFLDDNLEEGTEDEVEDKLYDALVAKLEAGELVGGEALAHYELDYPVLVEEGKIPAWAALRLLWSRYLAGRDYPVADRATFADYAPVTIDRVFGPDRKPLDDAALKKLALAFYRTCRRRAWGKGLAAKPDAFALVALLTQSPNPFLHLNPPDFGRVDLAALKKAEADGEDDDTFDAYPAATVASLNALDEDIRQGRTIDNEYTMASYYPAPNPTRARQDLARLWGMMADLETTRQPFSFGFNKKEEGELSLSELLGVNFLTPLEQQVEYLRRQNKTMLQLRRVVKVISDRYFGGLPVIMGFTEKSLDEAEEYLKIANQVLKQWADQLSAWPWGVDTSSLQLEDPEADEEEVEEIVDGLIHMARRRGRIKESEEELLGKE